MSKSTVLVTGITGFIGLHTAIQLLKKGYSVKGTLRDKSKIQKVTKIVSKHTTTDNLSFERCELMDETDWKYAVKDVDSVMHIASPVPSVMPKDRNMLILPARDGTLNVLKAAGDADVKKVIMTSSVSAIGYGLPKTSGVFTENDWTDIQNKKDVTAYSESKTRAERAAWDFMERVNPTFELSTINPVFVLGPILDSSIQSSSTIVVKRLLKGEVPGLLDMALDFVDVRDVADLHIKVLEDNSASGQRWIASAGVLHLKEMAESLRDAYPELSKKIPKRMLPNFLVRLVSKFDKEVASIVNELGTRRAFDNTKARNQLGWNPRSAEDALLATAGSLKELELV